MARIIQLKDWYPVSVVWVLSPRCLLGTRSSVSTLATLSMVVPDIKQQVMMTTKTGGASWYEESDLFELVTKKGTHHFTNRFTLVSNISFNPDNDNQVMIGTRSAGLFCSRDGGLKWEYISGSGKIPEVSSTFFTGTTRAIVSSYGRGLWRGECA